MEFAKKDILVLAIESSCDETAVSVVRNGREVLSQAIASQAHLHTTFGGVVPELASRIHIDAILPVLDLALKDAKVSLAEIDVFAATAAPGLVGALLVGFSAAKSLAQLYQKPFIAVHHIAGHIASNYLSFKDLKPPFLSLIISGGHTLLIHVKDFTSFTTLAKSRDDACGEAFDKLARALDLPYPGGPQIDALAQKGDDSIYKLPKVHFKDGSLDFSFSGLKTAGISYINAYKEHCLREGLNFKEQTLLADFAASYQRAIVDVLLEHSLEAAEKLNLPILTIAGGVSANSCMRKRCQELREQKKIKIYLPELKYCTDNASMIASMAYYQYLAYQQGIRFSLAGSLENMPNISSAKQDLINEDIANSNSDLYNSYVKGSILLDDFYEQI